MQYQYSEPAPRWRVDDNGFMKNTIRVNKVGTMEYLGDELGAMKPESVEPTDILNIMIHPDTLFDPESVSSLEGMPVIAYVHEWADPEGNFPKVGNVSGTPRQSGQFLECDIVVHDQRVIDAIQNGDLTEVSSGYSALYEIQNGVYDGKPYDGSQRQIRYNHVCLLGSNEGRAGADVRILNSAKQESSMTEFVKVQTPDGHNVRVAEADSDKLMSSFAAVQNAKPEAIQVNNEMMSGAQIEEELGKVTTLNDQIAALTGERDEALAKLQAVQEQLAAATNPEAVQTAANEMLEEQTEAVDMVSQNTGHETMNAEAVSKLREEFKGLSGHELRKAAVQKVRAINSRPELSQEDLDNTDKISGFFDSYKETPIVSAKKTVPGAEQITNAAAGSTRSGHDKLGFPKTDGGK